MSRTSRTNFDQARDKADSPRYQRLLAYRLRSSGGIALIAVSFWVVATLAIIAGRSNSGYHLRQYAPQAIHARADFVYFDSARYQTAQLRARELEPRVYRPSSTFAWATLEEQLRHLPDTLGRPQGETPETIRSAFTPAASALLAQYAAPERRPVYNQRVETFITSLGHYVILPPDQFAVEVGRQNQYRSIPSAYMIKVMDPAGTGSTGGSGGAAAAGAGAAGSPGGATFATYLDHVFTTPVTGALNTEISRLAAEIFHDDLAPQIADFTRRQLQPTHTFDENATIEAQERAGNIVASREGEVLYKAGVALKSPGEISEHDLRILQAEHAAFRESLGSVARQRDYLGIAGIVAIATGVLAWYIRRYQPRIMHNHARALAIALLLLGMIMLAMLAGPGTRPLYIFGIAPTILTAIILAIAYEPRFSLGVSLILATLTALALNQDIAFLITLLSGCCATCAFTGTVRTRGRLIEIGVASALAMVATHMFTGVWTPRGAIPFSHILDDAINVGLSGLGAGFVVLGILPFVEKTFRITTGMTLVELSDASHPLQRELATEAPGTYSHSLQVATLAEAAAEAIGANSMLARVGSLYHDLGKMRRPSFFCENQSHGDNAHLSLSPDVSFKIIVEHVAIGIEIARQNNLPTSLFSFIQQHHGTTLVEYFYHEACKQPGVRNTVQESAFRYPGPRPRTRETAIVMLADCCESAARAIDDPTPESIEKMVHGLTSKRFLDGQFADCDLTLHELDIVQGILIRNLISIHHSRIAYPAAATSPASAAEA